LIYADLNLIIDSGVLLDEKNVTSNKRDFSKAIKSISNLTTQ
jgi:hypothetical protein